MLIIPQGISSVALTYPISSPTLPEKPSPPVWPPHPFPAAPLSHSDVVPWFGGSWHLNSPMPFSLPYFRPPRLLESCLSSSISKRLRSSKQFHTYSHPSSIVRYCFSFSNGKFLRGTASHAGPQEVQPPEGRGLGVRLRLDPDCPCPAVQSPVRRLENAGGNSTSFRVFLRKEVNERLHLDTVFHNAGKNAQ